LHICIDQVKGEFEFEDSKNLTFDNIGQNKYFYNYEGTPFTTNIVEYLTMLRLAKISKKLVDEIPDIISPPDAYLRNMYVHNKPSPAPLVYPFYYGDKYELPTYEDALNSIDKFFIAMVFSPVDISVTDPLGREIGTFYKNGSINREITEISGVAIYTGSGTEPQYIIIADPEEGLYDIKVHGTGNGTYNLSVIWFHNDTVIYEVTQNNNPVKEGETFEYISAVDSTQPQITISTPVDGTIINTKNIEVSWDANDDIGLSHFEIFLDNVPYSNTIEISENLENLTEGLHVVEVKAYDFANNSASSSVSFTVDTITPDISVRYPEKVKDYQRFMVEADIIDINLQNVTFLQNSMPISYTISDNTYTSQCLGPYSAGTSLDYEIVAIDKADNTAIEEFSIDISKGELKISKRY
jgi:hypothetical protein